MRLYRTLLRLYPRAFRRAYGPEMCAILERRLRDAPGAGPRALAWAAAFADVPVSALRVHADILAGDLRLAARSLRRTPAFAATAVLVTALGIGAATTALAVADHVLLKPLPFHEPHRLVKIWEDHSFRGYARMELSPAAYRDWSEASRSFAGTAAYTQVQASLVGSGEPVRLDGVRATASLFEVLGVHASAGRTLLASDGRADAPAVVMIGEPVWRAQFGGDPTLVGRSILLDGTPHVVVGIAPASFNFPTRDARFWVPLRFGPDAFEDRGNNYLRAVARLAPGVTIEQARAELASVARGIAGTLGGDAAKVGATVVTMRDEVGWQPRAMLSALVAASICLLLIACANLAHLQLARAIARARELAVRTALGAGAERLVRQVATEALLIACAGGAAGVGLAVLATPLVSQLVPTALPIDGTAAVDARVMAAAVSMTALTALLFGVVPATRATRQDAVAVLSGSARAGTDRRTARVWSLLVAGEVAATVVLIVAASLLVQAFWRVERVDPGFTPDGALTMRTSLPWPRYEATASRDRFYRAVLEQVEALPGVTRAGYVSFLPMVMRGGIWPVEVPSSVSRDAGEQTASFRQVTPGFFEAMGTQIVAGRDVAASDTRESPFVAVVSASFARTHWPGQNPLGRTFTIAFFARTIVGVVEDIRVRGLERESEPQVYVPATQVPDGAVPFYAPQDLVVRAEVPLDSLVPAIRSIVRAVDPQQPIAAVRPLAAIVDQEMAPRVVQLRVLGLYVGLACVLAAVGLYGLLAFAAAARRRETGVRLALGATPARILAAALARGCKLVGLGLAVGTIGAVWAAHSLTALLAGLTPWQPAAFLVAGGVCVAVAVAGSVVPALRAARTDPSDALRSE